MKSYVIHKERAQSIAPQVAFQPLKGIKKKEALISPSWFQLTRLYLLLSLWSVCAVVWRQEIKNKNKKIELLLTVKVSV